MGSISLCSEQNKSNELEKKCHAEKDVTKSSSQQIALPEPEENSTNQSYNEMHIWMKKNGFVFEKQLEKVGDYADKAGYTPFLLTVYYGIPEGIEALSNSSRMSTRLKTGQSATDIARARGHTALANYLATYDPLGEKLGRAALQKNIEEVNTAIKQGANATWKDAQGRTPLMKAVWRGDENEKVVRRLLEEPNVCKDINAVDGDNRTALWYAVESSRDGNHYNIIDILLNHDADDSIACRSGSSFSSRANRDNRLKALYIPIFLKKKAGLSHEISQVIVEYYKKPMHSNSIENQLNLAIYYGRFSIPESNIELEDGFGDTPLLQIIRKEAIGKEEKPYTEENRLAMVSSILSQGADIDAQTEDGLNAMELAHKLGRTEVVKRLQAAKEWRSKEKQKASQPCSIIEVR